MNKLKNRIIGANHSFKRINNLKSECDRCIHQIYCIGSIYLYFSKSSSTATTTNKIMLQNFKSNSALSAMFCFVTFRNQKIIIFFMVLISDLTWKSSPKTKKKEVFPFYLLRWMIIDCHMFSRRLSILFE